MSGGEPDTSKIKGPGPTEEEEIERELEHETVEESRQNRV
jgi:putative ABC transport system ATP-binding protein